MARIVTPGALVLVAAEGVDPPSDLRLERVGEASWVLEPGRGGRPRAHLRAATVAAALDRVARHVTGETVGLALGAGAAFGLAHLGLLEVLEREEIPVDVVVGTSMGAIVGAALAAGVPVARMIALAEGVAGRYRRLVLQDLALRGPSLLSGSGVMEVLAELELRTATFEDLSVPFAASATGSPRSTPRYGRSRPSGSVSPARLPWGPTSSCLRTCARSGSSSSAPPGRSSQPLHQSRPSPGGAGASRRRDHAAPRRPLRRRVAGAEKPA